MSSDLHEKSLVIDGLMINNWGPEIFHAMKHGGLTAVNATCSMWEDFTATMKSVADWKHWFQEHSDTIIQVYSTDDILAAKEQGKVGIILGWQNTSGFGDYLPAVQLYYDLGLRIAQLTYNTANTVGSGCYESNDGGLTDFGRELVSEMNRVKMLIDLSHVGAKTTADTLTASSRPTAYTHVAPSSFFDHPRNKTDDELRAMAEHGGFIGVTMFPAFLPRGPRSTIDDYLESVEHVINIAGEEAVGIGTDFCEGRTEEQRFNSAHDKGHARKIVNYGELTMPENIHVKDFGRITEAMGRRGWTSKRIENVLGKNWFDFLSSAW